MKLNKDQIHELVEVFYQNPFKTFYVNSKDGENFTKPFGVFVSLGITTSLKSLEKIRDILSTYYGSYTVKLAEIKSKKSIAQQFLNTVTIEDNVKQYELLETPENCFDREESLKYFPISDFEESKWKTLFDKIEESDDGWSGNLLQVTNDNDVRIYHKFVNYKKDNDGIEYRIGIYVAED